MDLEAIKSKIVTNVYLIKSDKKVALHRHAGHDELFYCVKGEGYDDRQQPAGQFILNSCCF